MLTPVILIALIAGLLVAHQIYIYLDERPSSVFNLHTVFDSTIFLFFVVYPISHRGFLAAAPPSYFVHVLVGILGLYGGLHLFNLPGIVKNPLEKAIRTKPPTWFLWIGLIVFLAGSLSGILWKVGATGLAGISDYFLQGTTRQYLEGGILQGNWIARVAGSLTLVTLVLLNRHLLQGRYFVFTLTLSLILLVFLVGIASRYLQLVLVLLPIAYFHRRLKTRTGKVIMIGLVLLAGAIGLTALDVVRSGQTLGADDFTFSRVIYGLDRDLNPVSHSLDLYHGVYSGDIPFDYGEQYILKGLTPIPRAFWPDKPFTSFQPRYTEIVYGTELGSGEPVRTFTILGEGVALGGPPGVAIQFFGFGATMRVLRRSFRWNQELELSWIFLLLYIPAYVRGAFTDFLSAKLLIQVLPLLVFLRFSKAFRRPFIDRFKWADVPRRERR